MATQAKECTNEAPTASPELRGGQVWTQPEDPFFSCYLVYVAGGEDRKWCRIHLPEEQGNVAMTDIDGGGPLYSTGAMSAALKRMRYECKGQYSDILKAQAEASWSSAQALYAEPAPNSETESALLKAQEVTAKQAKDLSLWFKAMTGNEVRFQKALLELHQVIDGDDFLGNFKLADIARAALAERK